MRVPPAYIQASGVLEASPKFPWKGPGQHFGPEQGTKLHDALAKLTTCAHATVCALVEEWLAWRCRACGVDIEPYLHHADATLAWEIDRRYRDREPDKDLIVHDTPAHEALSDAIWRVRLATNDDYWDDPETPDMRSASLVSITKQTLPDKAKKAFLTWLDWAIARAAKLDSQPKKKIPEREDFDSDEEYRDATRPYFGQPLPREALDPDANYKPEQREKLLARFLEGLDWKENPFLRSPADMKKLGFKGTPYKL